MSNLPSNASSDDYGGSKYFNAEYVRDHGPFRDLTISDVNEEPFERRDGKPGKDVRLVLSFREHERMLALNTTNKNILKEAFGDLVRNWIGKSIDVVFDKTVVFAGKATGGVRIEVPEPSLKQQPKVRSKQRSSEQQEHERDRGLQEVAF